MNHKFTLKKIRNRDSTQMSLDNASKARPPISGSQVQRSTVNSSEFGVVVSNTPSMWRGCISTTPSYISPDYENEIFKKRSSIETDKHGQKLLLFPSNEVKLTASKRPSALKWYSLYGVEDVAAVNALGKKTIEALSSRIQDFILDFSDMDYDKSFTQLPNFKHYELQLYQHQYPAEIPAQLDNLNRLSSFSHTSTHNTLYSGYMEMYPPLVESNVSVEKWVDSTKPKKKFFSLDQTPGQSYTRLEYKESNDDAAKYDGVIFIENCTTLRQLSSFKATAFQMHINEKILIFVCPNPEEYKQWVKTISDASGIMYEENSQNKTTNMKKVNDLQETWAKSEIESLVEYSKQNENSNFLERSQIRYNIYDVFPDIIDFLDTVPEEKQPVCLLGEFSGERIIFEYKGFNFDMTYTEPYIVVFTVYDISHAAKLTEDFYCDPTDPSLREVLKKYNITENYNTIIKKVCDDLTSKTVNSCVFCVPAPSDKVFLVAKFYKMYTANLNSIWELFLKWNEKNDVKLSKQLKSCSEKVKKYLMPIGFSFKKLYKDTGLDCDSPFSPLIKYDYKYSTSEMCRFIEEFTNDNKMKCFSIPVTISYSLKLEQDSKKKYLTTSYEGIHPFESEDNNLIQELETISTTSSRFRGFPYPINIMFIEFMSCNLLNVKSSIKIKNFCITCEVFNRKEVEGPDQLPLIFDKSSSISFTKCSSSIVVFDNYNPYLMDEFKILLPAICMPNLHVVFTFRSVFHEDKGDPKKVQYHDSPFGYCWIKLFDNNSLVRSGEYYLPIISALPANYLNYNLEKYEKTKPPPELKFIDSGGKNIFKFNVNFHTNYHSSNGQLFNALNIVSEKGINMQSYQEINTSFKWLESLESAIIITNLYVILDFLFSCINNTSTLKETAKEKAEEMQKNIIRVLLRVCGEVCKKHRDDVLRGYVKYRFDPTNQNTQKNTIHEVLLDHLYVSLNYGTEPVLTDNLFMASWFFLDVIAKCVADEAIKNNKIITNRKKLLKPDTIEKLETLVGLIVYLIKNRAAEDYNAAKKINAHLGKFVNKCFSLLDRGVVMRILCIIMQNCKGDEKINVSLRFEILIIISNYRNFIPLNLPFHTPQNKNMMYFLRELSEHYSSCHFPLFLILSEVREVIGLAAETRRHAIQIMRNLLKKHHFDDRYNNDEMRCRIHVLYLPFITILVEKCDLIVESAKNNITSVSSMIEIFDQTQDSQSNTLNRKKWATHYKTVNNAVSNQDLKSPEPSVSSGLYNTQELRDIFTMFYQIIKCVDVNIIVEYLRSFSSQSYEKSKQAKTEFNLENGSTRKGATLFIEKFLKMLKTSLTLFGGVYCKSKKNLKNMSNIGGTGSPTILHNENLSQFESYLEKNRKDLELNLQNEVFVVILDMIEKIYFSCKVHLEYDNGQNDLMKEFFALNISLMQSQCSVLVRKYHFAILRLILSKSSNIFFKESNSYCYQLCFQILQIANTYNDLVKNEVKYFVYLILRSDYFHSTLLYHRSYVSIIMACSSVVGLSKSVNFLLELMRSLWEIVRCDAVLKNGEFANEISDLTKRVKNIVKLTLRFSELESDPESLVDAHCSIAKSFSEIPELRASWLEKIAKLHEKNKDFSEAGMCYLEIASLISLTLKRKNILLEGPAMFKSISSNISSNECFFKENALSDESKHSVSEFIRMVDKASEYFFQATRFEYIPELVKRVVPLLEKEENYEELSAIYEKIKKAYDKIIETKGKRMLGQYYRVYFLGHSFKDDHDCEYIYKEPLVTKLPEVVARLKELYNDKCINLTIIQESVKIKWKDLDQNKDYIQIYSVTPNYVFNKGDKDLILSHFNMGSFVVETPFTKTGRTHGASPAEQWRRLTVFKTAQTFPYIKKRIPIVKKEITELTPIEVAIEDITSKGKNMRSIVEAPVVNKKTLQLIMQGAISPSVNAGPFALVEVFLKPDVRSKFAKNERKSLENVFKDFIEICEKAVEIYSDLMEQTEIPFHEQLCKDLDNLKKNFNNMINTDKSDKSDTSSSTSNTTSI